MRHGSRSRGCSCLYSVISCVCVCVSVSKNIFQRVVKGFFLRCQNRQTALRHSLRGKARGKGVRGDQGEFNFEPTNQRISLGTALISPKGAGQGRRLTRIGFMNLFFMKGEKEGKGATGETDAGYDTGCWRAD